MNRYLAPIALAILACQPCAHAILFTDPDINDDGVVNFLDLGLLRECFFSSPLPDSPCAATDFNGDGVVNFSDLGILRGAFFDNYPAPIESAFAYLPAVFDTAQAATAFASFDVNADGLPDLAFAYASTTPGDQNPRVAVFIKRDGVGYDSPLYFAMDDTADEILAAQVDSDSSADLITANYATGTLMLFAGDGSGAFVQAGEQLGATPLADVAIGDINADGFSDLVIVGAQAGEVVLLQGTGSSTFAADVVVDGAFEHTSSALLADMNNDGFDDLVTTSAVDLAFRSRVSLGDGTFNLEQDIAASSVQLRAAADTNMDGCVDIVTAGPSLGVTALFGLCNGRTGSSTQNFLGPGTMQAFAIGDYDGDMLLDFAVATQANPTGDRVLIGRGRAGGGFDSPDETDIGVPGITIASLLATDVNADGVSELLVNYDEADRPGFAVATNVEGEFARNQTLDLNERPNDIAFGDLNEDGLADVIYRSAFDFSLNIRFATVGGGFVAGPSIPLGYEAGRITLADINADNHLDILSTGVDSSGTDAVGASAWLGTGTGAFSQSWNGSANRFVLALVAEDVTQDNIPDIVLYHSLATSAVAVYPGAGDGTFGQTISTASTGQIVDMVISDFNGDSLKDVITLGLFSKFVRFHAGTGGGAFAPATIIPLPHEYFGIEAADLDADGSTDLALISRSDLDEIGGLWSMLGDGTGGFATPIRMPATRSLNDLKVADIDGDGRVDAVAVSTSEEAVFIALGNGGGGFMQPVRAPIGQLVRNVALVEVNGSEKISIGVSAFDAEEVVLLEQQVD